MIRLLVTGSEGVIGATVCARARALGLEVLTHRGLPESDLTDPRAVSDLLDRTTPEVIINATGANYGSPEILWAANLAVPVTIAQESLKRDSVRRIVLIGSAAEYGLTDPGQVLTEQSECRPNSAYGYSKLAATIACCAMSDVVVVARLFNLVTDSPDPRSLLGRLVAAYASGESDPPGAEAVRDFVTVTEASDALVRLAVAPEVPRVVNICTGVATTAAAHLGRITARRADAWAVGDPTRLQSIQSRFEINSRR